MNEHVWVIDDDSAIRWVLDRALSQASIPITAFNTADQALHHLNDEAPLAIITDIRMPGTSGLEFLEQVQISHPDVPIIVMTAHSDLQSAVNSFERGAFEYLPKPFDVDDAVAVVQRAIAHTREITPLTGAKPEEPTEIIGKAPAMQEVFRAIGRLSSSNVSVLINGPSGSGKELVARALHRHSPRQTGPLVALNVAAITRTPSTVQAPVINASCCVCIAQSIPPSLVRSLMAVFLACSSISAAARRRQIEHAHHQNREHLMYYGLL